MELTANKEANVKPEGEFLENLQGFLKNIICGFVFI